jgi:hypothetical protein
MIFFLLWNIATPLIYRGVSSCDRKAKVADLLDRDGVLAMLASRNEKHGGEFEI